MSEISPTKSKPIGFTISEKKEVEIPKWLNLTMAAFWFIGLFLMYWMYQITDISLGELFKWFLFFAVILTLVPFKYVRKKFEIDKSQLIALNVIGFGPIFTSLFLICNLVFSTSKVTTEYEIWHFERSKVPFENNFLVVDLKENALIDQPKFRRFDYTQHIENVMTYDSIRMTISHGAFGFDVMTDFTFH